jgi:RNA polymerase sigma-70 factor (ECF subfamily)
MSCNCASASDGELIERAARRDHAAFAALYERHSRRVFGLALRRLNDRGRAEDATQDTFAAIWRSAGSYRRERGSGTSWLYTVARNAVIDQARSRAVAVAATAAPFEVEDEGPGPARLAEGAWVKQRVHHAVGRLPEKEATLIELAYWHGLSQSEIAAKLELPLGTVKTRTRAALARLADTLEDEQLL